MLTKPPGQKSSNSGCVVQMQNESVVAQFLNSLSNQSDMCRTFIYLLLAFNTFSQSSVILSVNNTAQKPQAEALSLPDTKLSIIFTPIRISHLPFYVVA